MQNLFITQTHPYFYSFVRKGAEGPPIKGSGLCTWFSQWVYELSLFWSVVANKEWCEPRGCLKSLLSSSTQVGFKRSKKRYLGFLRSPNKHHVMRLNAIPRIKYRKEINKAKIRGHGLKKHTWYQIIPCIMQFLSGTQHQHLLALNSK